MQFFYRAATTVAVCFFLFYVLMTSQGCANIVPPTGGAKDSLPPNLIRSTPLDSANNVRTQKIILEFDEYINIDNVQQNLVVSPFPVKSPVVSSKFKTITITLKDSLEINTTYALDFGNAIKDVNEGNVFKNFTYVFSTGNTLSNGMLGGKVLLAQTGKADSTLIVVLHPNLNDTAVIKNRPRYIAKIDGNGNFMFHHLPEETFNVFVLPDDYSKKYDDSTKVFAFNNTPVTISDSVQSLNLLAFQQVLRTVKPPGTSAQQKNNNTKKDEDKRLKYTTNIQTPIDYFDTVKLVFNRPIQTFDAAKFLLTDTSFNKINNYKVELDSNQVYLTHAWPLQQSFNLIIIKDAIADSSGTSLLKNDTLNISTRGEKDYGSIKLRFMNIDISKNPVLQLVQNDVVVEAAALTNNTFQRKLFIPGEYEIRILYDDNKNGKWDTGNYFLKQQPEKVITLQRKINIRANWDNESDVTL